MFGGPHLSKYAEFILFTRDSDVSHKQIPSIDKDSVYNNIILVISIVFFLWVFPKLCVWLYSVSSCGIFFTPIAILVIWFVISRLIRS
jgi:hypothetical protein